MANVYVRSGAAGAGTGADWANAYTTLAAALTAKAAGDSFWVSEDHAETTAATVTLTSPGTTSNPCFIYCVNHSGTVPPVSADLRTTGTVTSTGGTSDIAFNGYAYCEGLAFTAGRDLLVGTSGSAYAWIFENGALSLSAVANRQIIFGSTGGVPTKCVLKNTTLQFGATSQIINIRSGLLEWRATASAIAGATLPTTLFVSNGQVGGIGILEGVDLSALGSGKTLVSAAGGDSAAQQYYLKDCKLGASVTIANSPLALGGHVVYVTRSDSGATNYRSEKYHYLGTETTETTIVRTGGATDGTTPQSRKLATTANSRWVMPFEALPITFWNETITGNITITLEANGPSLPNNDDIWIDVEYLGSALTPLGSFATSSKADNLATGTPLSASSASWAGGTTAFTLTKAITAPAQKGPVTVYVKVGKASATFYVDPLVTLT